MKVATTAKKTGVLGQDKFQIFRLKFIGLILGNGFFIPMILVFRHLVGDVIDKNKGVC